jgi:hypothetical protein
MLQKEREKEWDKEIPVEQRNEVKINFWLLH